MGNNAFDAVRHYPHAWVQIDWKQGPSGFVELSVIDCGRGIPADVAEKMMQPFFTTKPVGKGTGLGLSISIGIVESHGGKLWLDAEYSNTRFVFNVPAARPAQGAKRAA